MDTGSKQASSIVGEANSKKLLSVILTFILATTLMVPHTAWADEGAGDGESSAPTVEALTVDSAASADAGATFNNVLYANGKDVVVAPAAEDGLTVTVDGTAYSFANNSTDNRKDAGTDGLTIFAGGAADCKGSPTITIKDGAKVGAIFAGGNKANLDGTATVVVEKGAEAGIIFGGGLTPAKDSTSSAQTTASAITVDGTVGIVYAGGMASVGPAIADVVSFDADAPADSTAKNYVGSSQVTINGTAGRYFGGSYSYGGVGTVDCVLNGSLTASYSAIAGTNGFRGAATMAVSETGKIEGLLYMSMRGYIGDTKLENNGSINALTLLPDGKNVSTYGNTEVVNNGTIARAHLDCGCAKEPVAGSSISPYPAKISVSGDVAIRTTTIDESNGNAEVTTSSSALPEGTELALSNGATYAGYAVQMDGQGYESLEAAAAQAVAGSEIELLASCVTEPVTFAKNVAIDLGGNTLTVVGDSAGTNYGLQFTGAGVSTLKNGTLIDSRSLDNQTSNWRAVRVSGDASFSSEKVTIQTYCPDAANYNYLIFAGSSEEHVAKSVELGTGTVLEELENTSKTVAETAGAIGVNLIGSTQDASKVTDDYAEMVSLSVADGVTITTTGYAITGNGTCHGTEITINGGTITSTASAAIYHPQAGNLTLNGGVLKGATGIQLCSGEAALNTEFQVNGGTVSGVGEDERATKTGDGLVGDGAAISLVNRDYPGGVPSMVIDGGMFTSVNADAVLAYTWSKGADGKFVASEWKEAADNIVINGGTYSSDVSAYVAEGLACSKISEGVYQVQKKIVNDDGNVEVQAPVVSEGNVPADKPGIPESDALANIAGSLGGSLVKGEEPVKDSVIAGNKIESGKDAEINTLVKDADEKEAISAKVVVASVPVSEEAVDADEAAAIKEIAGKDSSVSFYDLSVKLVVEKKNADSPDQNALVEAAVTETAEAIPFQIKVDGLVGKDVKVIRYHGDKAEAIDATVDYATGVVSFAGDKFSTYAVALADAKVTVTFDSNGGSDVAEAEVAKGGLVKAPEAPAREGYTFGGWYSDEALTTAWDFDADRATGDMTLYAKWNQATPDLPATASRLGGDDRYKTMALISKASFPTDGSCETVIIARGSEFPDALAASALAGVKDAQVLITETDELTAETKAEIKRLGAKNAIVLGDENSITERTYNEIKSLMTGTTTRVGGDTRLETAYEIYKANTGWGKTAIVATGKKAADSLSISPIAYSLQAPIFLAADDGTVSKDVLDAIAKGGFDRVIVLGDKYSVSDDTVAGIKKLVENTERLGGTDRYATSQLTADWAMKNCDFTCANAMLTAGRDGKYADALVASSLGGRNASPLLLVDEGEAGATCIDKTLAANKADVEKAYVLGDKWTVSDELLKAIEKAIA